MLQKPSLMSLSIQLDQKLSINHLNEDTDEIELSKCFLCSTIRNQKSHTALGKQRLMVSLFSQVSRKRQDVTALNCARGSSGWTLAKNFSKSMVGHWNSMPREVVVKKCGDVALRDMGWWAW